MLILTTTDDMCAKETEQEVSVNAHESLVHAPRAHTLQAEEIITRLIVNHSF